MRSLRTLSILALAAVLAVSFVGCSSGSGNNSQGSGGGSVKIAGTMVTFTAGAHTPYAVFAQFDPSGSTTPYTTASFTQAGSTTFTLDLSTISAGSSSSPPPPAFSTYQPDLMYDTNSNSLFQSAGCGTGIFDTPLNSSFTMYVYTQATSSDPEVLLNSYPVTLYLMGAQQCNQTTPVGTSLTYYLKVQNSGVSIDTPPTNIDSYLVQGSTAENGWTVHYAYQTGGSWQEITSQVTGAGWTTPQLTQGDAVLLRLVVTPTSATTGTSSIVMVSATSTNDSTKKDAMWAITQAL